MTQQGQRSFFTFTFTFVYYEWSLTSSDFLNKCVSGFLIASFLVSLKGLDARHFPWESKPKSLEVHWNTISSHIKFKSTTNVTRSGTFKIVDVQWGLPFKLVYNKWQQMAAQINYKYNRSCHQMVWSWKRRVIGKRGFHGEEKCKWSHQFIITTLFPIISCKNFRVTLL